MTDTPEPVVTLPAEIQRLKAAVATAWDAFEEAAEIWECYKSGPEKTDRCLDMMNAGAAYTVAQDDLNRALADYRLHPSRWNDLDDSEDKAATEAALRSDL